MAEKSRKVTSILYIIQNNSISIKLIGFVFLLLINYWNWIPDVRYLDGDNEDDNNDNLQTEIAQIHHNRDKSKRNRSGDKRSMPSSNNRGGHSRSRDVNSDDDISDDDISNDGIGDSEYDDEDVDDSLSTKSSRIHHNRGHHQSNRSNTRPGRDSSRPRSTVRYFVLQSFLKYNYLTEKSIMKCQNPVIFWYFNKTLQTRIESNAYYVKKLANWN